MRCEGCGKIFDSSLMLARHVLRQTDTAHEGIQDWANGILTSLRASMKTGAEASARLTKAFQDGWMVAEEGDVVPAIPTMSNNPEKEAHE